jgi:hypothetical protein
MDHALMRPRRLLVAAALVVLTLTQAKDCPGFHGPTQWEQTPASVVRR